MCRTAYTHVDLVQIRSTKYFCSQAPFNYYLYVFEFASYSRRKSRSFLVSLPHVVLRLTLKSIIDYLWCDPLTRQEHGIYWWKLQQIWQCTHRRCLLNSGAWWDVLNSHEKMCVFIAMLVRRLMTPDLFTSSRSGLLTSPKKSVRSPFEVRSMRF